MRQEKDIAVVVVATHIVAVEELGENYTEAEGTHIAAVEAELAPNQIVVVGFEWQASI